MFKKISETTNCVLHRLKMLRIKHFQAISCKHASKAKLVFEHL